MFSSPCTLRFHIAENMPFGRKLEFENCVLEHLCPPSAQQEEYNIQFSLFVGSLHYSRILCRLFAL